MIFVFLLIVLLSIYSYLIYPITLVYLFKKTKINNPSLYNYKEKRYAIIVAAYNEALHLPYTIPKILDAISNFRNIDIYIADDGSTDQTPLILEKFNSINTIRNERIGKVNAINKLVEAFDLTNTTDIIFMIDANIYLEKDTLINIAEKFSNTKLGVVGCRVLPNSNKKNIESEYVSRENDWKYMEGEIWNASAGVFGACYGIRSSLLYEIPSQVATDDLYLTFRTFEKNLGAAIATNSIVKEEIDADIQNEWNRKRRYSTGNFYIFFKFFSLFFTNKLTIGTKYALFFHKIVRWWLPIVWTFFLGIEVLKSLLLYTCNFGLIITIFAITCFLILAIFHKFGIKKGEKLFYFSVMNLAILFGFFDYILGKQQSKWERSKRQLSENK